MTTKKESIEFFKKILEESYKPAPNKVLAELFSLDEKCYFGIEHNTQNEKEKKQLVRWLTQENVIVSDQVNGKLFCACKREDIVNLINKYD